MTPGNRLNSTSCKVYNALGDPEGSPIQGDNGPRNVVWDMLMAAVNVTWIAVQQWFPNSAEGQNHLGAF